jgi:hypothetical protein
MNGPVETRSRDAEAAAGDETDRPVPEAVDGDLIDRARRE